MKIRNKILNIAFAAVLLGSATGCTDLESTVYDSFNDSNFPITADDVEALIVGSVYKPFRSQDWNGLFCYDRFGIATISDMASDILVCNWGDDMWYNLCYGNFTMADPSPRDAYMAYINSFARMLYVEKAIKENEYLSAAEKERAIAETYCGLGWLGYIYYDLWGPIQMITQEAIDNPAEKIPTPRLTKEETCKFIETKLKYAAEHLPADTYYYGDSNYGRFTRALAHMVLMKFYMHEGRWSDAEACGRELIDSKYGFKLEDDYESIFAYDNQGNRETIWAATCDGITNTWLWHAAILPGNYPTKNPAIQKWNGYRMCWKFYDTYEWGDDRLKTIIAEYQGTDGVYVSRNNPGQNLHKGAIPMKYGEDPTDTGLKCSIDVIVYRYADLITLLAEAIVRNKNAVTDEALGYLNDIRKRAKLTEYKLSQVSSVDIFLDKILEERGHELYAEGCRRSDLIRHGKWVQKMQEIKGSNTAQSYMELFPIPQSCITESGNVVHQNPEY